MKKSYEKNVEDTRKGSTHIKFSLYYSLGGWNCFTCDKEPRGLYISFQPVDREERDGGWICEKFTAFTGEKFFLKEMNRFSQKTFDEYVEKVTPHIKEMINLWVNGQGQNIFGLMDRIGC